MAHNSLEDNPISNNFSRFHKHVVDLQQEITLELQRIDSKIVLIEDVWKREDFDTNPGGGGLTRAFMGEVFENAGVNTSHVFGRVSPQFAETMGGRATDLMEAAGISLIIHPKNPRVPTVHANFRMISFGNKFWFGGGADLTPFYPHTEDFIYFHSIWKEALAPYGQYQKMKDECDRYFVNHHRDGEMRGIGGIFFDHFNSQNFEKDFKMVKDLSSYFIKSYFPIVEKRANEEFTIDDEDFQLHRRGRYIEFNLLHDRGTMFGLKTNGRTDSILISLPARAKYTYKYRPKDNSPHAEMMSYYLPKDWV